MKTRFILLLTFLYGCCNSYAQNLVPNPSFEEYDLCPTGLDHIENSVGWVSTRSSPDYFNTCANFVNNNSASAPCNGLGCQMAAFGNSYAGFWAKINSSGYREYLGISLLSELEIGKRYYITLKVNLSASPYDQQYCGVNKIGVLFSTISYTKNNPSPQNNIAQVYTETIITDTLNWVGIKGSFIADSAYTFVSIGNFFSDLFTDSIQISGSECQSYYFIDDVCVSPDSNYCSVYTSMDINNDLRKSISIYPNPASDFININLNTNVYSDIAIYDELGRELYLKQQIIQPLEHIPIDGFDGNILLVKITNKKQSIIYKVIKRSL